MACDSSMMTGLHASFLLGHTSAALPTNYAEHCRDRQGHISGGPLILVMLSSTTMSPCPLIRAQCVEHTDPALASGELEVTLCRC